MWQRTSLHVLFGITESEDPAYTRVASEILREDGNARWREWRAYRLGGALALVVLALAALLAWAVYHVSRVHVVVQVVQHDEQGRMVKVGVPMDLLTYQPQEGAVRNMLAEWVNKRHWRGEEESEVRARHDWRWLYLHTCGMARKQLEEAERKDNPFKKSTKRVQVDVETITKTMTPQSYQVLWKAITIDKYNPKARRSPGGRVPSQLAGFHPKRCPMPR